MQARVMRITASVDCWMAASGTFSIVTSWMPCMTVARISFCSCEIEILLVGDMLHPGDGRAVERFLDRDVSHGGRVGRAVPMLVIGRAPYDVAGADLDPLLAFALGPAGAGRHDQRLPERMRMPGGSSARLEAHAGAADARRLGGVAQRFDGHLAGKPFGRPLL